MTKVAIYIENSSGEALSPSKSILACEFSLALNRILYATLSISEPLEHTEGFKHSASTLFELGQTLTISLKAATSDQDIKTAETLFLFRGVVIRQELTTLPKPALKVELRDAAHRLTNGRKTVAHHVDGARLESDAAVIRKLIRDAGLEIGDFDPTTALGAELLQSNCSDWDFMVARAEVHGMVLLVSNGKVGLRNLDFDSGKGFSLQYDKDKIIDINLSLDMRDAHASIASTTWAASSEKPAKPRIAKEPQLAVGNMNPQQVSQALGLDAQTLFHGAPITQDESTVWAESKLKRERFAILRGRAVLPGNRALAPLNHLQLANFNERYDGKVLISEVTHQVTEGEWQSEVTLGIAPEPFASTPGIAELPASGLLPPVSNLHIGTVAPGHKQDPQHNYRVLVSLPAASDLQGGVWARMARPDAGAQGGILSWPEPGDEVVLGYLDGDPRHPIILGVLHNPNNPPPKTVQTPSASQRLVTMMGRGGAQVTVDDSNSIVLLQTPGGNTVAVDDSTESITVQDQHGNAILLGSHGITLSSASKLAIQAKGAVTISGSTVDVDV